MKKNYILSVLFFCLVISFAPAGDIFLFQPTVAIEKKVEEGNLSIANKGPDNGSRNIELRRYVIVMLIFLILFASVLLGIICFIVFTQNPDDPKKEQI